MGRYIVSRSFSGQYFLCVLIMFAFLLFSFGGMCGNVGISTYEAYILFMNSESDFVFFLLIVYISLGYPMVNGRQNLVMRTGWKRWLLYEIASLFLTVMAFSVTVILEIFLVFPSLSRKYHVDFFAAFLSGGTGFQANLGRIGNLTGWVLFDSSLKTFFISFLSHTLLAFMCGLLCLLFNMGEKRYYSVLIIAFLKYMPLVMRSLLYNIGRPKAWSFFWNFDFFDIIKVSFMKIKCYGEALSVEQVIGRLIFFIIFLIWIIILRRQKCLK